MPKIIGAMDFDGYEAFADIAASEFELLLKDGAEKAVAQVGGSLTVEALDLTNEQAVAYARDRAAEMVGMKRIDGELVENPNAEWAITDGTRELVRGLVGDAIGEGWSNDKLASELTESYAFSDERAEVIARTETARADVQGTLAGYSASGLVSGKEWLTAAGCCDECQDLDKVVVGLDEQFPNGGGDGAPLHPQCRCDVLPVLSEESQEKS